ncbi:TPA: hypothetical protein ACOENI_001107 [Stenotrophomonas maltophilia]
MNAAGLRAATAVVAGLLLPALAAAADCRTPLRIAWPADRAPLSSSEQGQPRGLSAQYLKLLGAQRPLQMQPLPTAAIAEGTVPPDVQALLGWSRSQLPTGWVASAPYVQLPQVIVRRRDASPVLGLEALRGGTVASPDPLSLVGCSGVRYIRGGCEISSRKTPEESWQWRIEMESHCAWCNQGAVRNRLI